MARFATVKAKVVLYAVLPLSSGEVSSFLEQGSALGSIDFCICGLIPSDFSDLGIGVVTGVLCGVAWVGEYVPILVEFSSFIN